MKILKKLGILSLAYVLAIFYGLAGILQGFALAFQINDSTIRATMNPIIVSLLDKLGGWILLIAPFFGLIIGLIAGFISGIIIAVLYNFVAKWTGGIKIEFEEHKK